MTDTQDQIREVKVHSISLNRPRAKKRTAANRPPSVSWASWVLGSVRTGVSRILEPPQKSWLAFLGLSSLAMKSTGQAWDALVSEGADVQADLGRRINDVARRVGSSVGRKEKEARPPL